MKPLPAIALGCLAGVWLLAVSRPAPSTAEEEKAKGDQGAFPLEGTWRWNFVMPDGTAVRPKLKLTTEKGEITGTTSFRPGSEASVTNALINGDQLRFQIIRQRDGQDVVTTYSGTWTTNAITGRIESNWAGEKQTFPWNAQRANIGAEGIWRWTNSLFRGFGGGGGDGQGRGRGPGGEGAGEAAAQTNRPAGGEPGAGPGGRDPGGRGRGGGRGFETRVELEQDGEKLTGKTVGRFGRSAAITNGFFTNGVIYFEIERVFFDNRTVTRYQGKQAGDSIKGTMESEVEGEERTIDWEATRVD